MSLKMEGTLTEFEESLSFDVDDPDFAPSSACFQESSGGRLLRHTARFDVYCIADINDVPTKCKQLKTFFFFKLFK